MRVALIHDWLTGLRGGEKVLEVLCELFPSATIFTLLHIPGSSGPIIESHPIRTPFTQKLPGVRTRYRWYLPLFPRAIESLDLSGYDLVVSSSHCVAKGALPPPGVKHVCYCHTPMRYIWDRFHDYFGHGLKARLVFGPTAHLLRRWDVASSSRVDHFVANSKHVAERIRRYYRREVDAVIPPPVDTDFFVPSDSAEGSVTQDPYYLVVSALVPYKRLDVAIDAFNRRKERLYIVGTGPEESRLRRRSGSNIQWLGTVSREKLRTLYQHCHASLLPGVEDFGIAPLETQACGRPAVAFAEGGARETVKDGITGVLFEEPTPRSLSGAIDRLSSLSLNKQDLRAWALEFSRERFKSRIQAFIEKSGSAGKT